MTSTERRSSRLGMRTSPGPVHKGTEFRKESGRIMRARRCLGVVLDAERRLVEQAEALDHAVIEVDVGDLGGPEVGAERGARGGTVLAWPPFGTLLARQAFGAVGQGHREAVIVAGDLHLAGGQVLDRLVHAAVPEPELVGPQAESPAQDLAAQADAKHRDAPGEDAPDRVHGVASRSRVARTV